MSGSGKKLLAIKRATDKFEAHTAVLTAELDRGTSSRAALEALLELCALYAGATGGTLVTQGLQKRLEPLHARIQTRSHLREVKPTMQIEIEVDAACAFCGSPGFLFVAGDGQFECHCSGCYDGTGDAHLSQQTRGFGPTPREAVDAWQEEQANHLPEHVGWWPTRVADQARAEFRRQAGWVKTPSAVGGAVLLAPPTIEAAE
jgi:hypothetical protein